MRKFCQFLSTFHLKLKQVCQTTCFDAHNNHNQISQELVSVRDMAEDAEVRSGTSSTTRSAKNLLLNMAKDAEVGGDDETVKRSPSKKPSRPTGYLISLYSEKMSFP